MKKANLAKKSLSAILALAMLVGILAMLPITVGATDTTVALATEEDPILIGDTTALNGLATSLSNAKAARSAATQDDTYYVEFTADINYNGGTITTLNLSSYSVHVDGKDHIVSNYSAAHGIFYQVGTNSTIQNLHATDVSISNGNAQAGAILGYALGGFTMINCSATGTITNTRTSNTPAVGGLVGSLQAGTYDHYFADCVNRVNVTATSMSTTYAGGILGKAYSLYANITIENCQNYGTINGKAYVGGILGGVENAHALTIKECVNEGAVTGTTYVGGILGYGKCAATDVKDYTFSYNLNKGDVKATSYAGGMIGYTTGTTRLHISNCGNEGTITNEGNYTSAILAYANVTKASGSRHWISGCYADGKLVAPAGVSGGIIGALVSVGSDSLTISECYDDADREVTESDHYLLAGSITGCSTVYFSRSFAVKKTGANEALAGSTVTDPEHSAVVDTNTSTVYTDYYGKVASTFDVQMAKRKDNVWIRKPDGLGTQESPYLIGTAHELMWFAGAAVAESTLDSMTYVELTADIDYDGRTLCMDLMEADRGYLPRSLHFDGKNHTISDYVSYTGIFARLGPNSTVQNLHVVGATVTAPTSGYYHAGAIIGSAYPGLTMINCSTDSTTTVTQNKSSSAVGGLVGSFETVGNPNLVINCRNAATVVGVEEAGGIAGKISDSGSTTDLIFMNCSNSGSITSSGTLGVGGILGYGYRVDQLSFYSCTNTGAVTASSTAVAGGIIGQTSDNSASPATLMMQSCRNEGTITAAGTYAAGIIGYGQVATSKTRAWSITACANVGNVTGATNNGGIIGAINDGVSALTLTNCYTTTTGKIMALSSSKATQTSCSAEASVPADLQAVADARINTAAKGGKLSIRVKLTDGFGLMAITEINTNGTVQNLSNYQEVGFYFAESDERLMPADLVKDANKIVGGAYNGSATRFNAAYTDLHVATLDRNLYFMAYAIDHNGNMILSDMRTMDVQALIEDLADGYMGKTEVVKDEYEMALYQKMLAYGAAYEQYENIDIKIGNLNLAQDNFKKASNSEIDSSVATIEANLQRYADTMYDLGLDIMGMNEVNLYRGSSTLYGGYNVPWEVAQKMEAKTGQKYYWAFASALDSSATYSDGTSLRSFYNRYADLGLTGENAPDGRWYSNDGDTSAIDTAGYGEGIVSKYPIVSYEAKYIVPASMVTEPTDTSADDYAEKLEEYNTYSKYTESYQYDPATNYERRVILIVQLDLDGDLNNGKSELVTVMVSHFDHTNDTIALQAAVQAVQEVVADPQYSNTPIFLMGDLNVQRHSTTIMNLDKTLNRSGMGDMTNTFAGGSKIDYVYYGNYTEILSYGVDRKNIASDHFPTYVTARIKRTAFR